MDLGSGPSAVLSKHYSQWLLSLFVSSLCCLKLGPVDDVNLANSLALTEGMVAAHLLPFTLFMALQIKTTFTHTHTLPLLFLIHCSPWHSHSFICTRHEPFISEHSSRCCLDNPKVLHVTFSQSLSNCPVTLLVWNLIIRIFRLSVIITLLFCWLYVHHCFPLFSLCTALQEHYLVVLMAL